MADIAAYDSEWERNGDLFNKADLEFVLRDQIAEGVVINRDEIVSQLNTAFKVDAEPVEGTKHLFFCNRFVYIVQQVDDVLRGQRTFLPYAGNDPGGRVARFAKLAVVALIKRIKLNTGLYECYYRELEDEVEDLYFSMVCLRADSVIYPAGADTATPRKILPLYGLIDSMSPDVKIDAIQLAYDSVSAGARRIGRLQAHGGSDIYTDAYGGIYVLGYDGNWFTIEKHGVQGTSAGGFVDALQTMWCSMPEREIVAMAVSVCRVQNAFRGAGQIEAVSGDIQPGDTWSLNWRVPRVCKIRLFSAIAEALLDGDAVSVNSNLVYVNISSRCSVKYSGIGRRGFTIAMTQHTQDPVAFFNAVDTGASDADTDLSDPSRGGSDVSDSVHSSPSASVTSAPVSPIRRGESGFSAGSGSSGSSRVSTYSERGLNARLLQNETTLTHTLSRLLTLFE